MGYFYSKTMEFTINSSRKKLVYLICILKVRVVQMIILYNPENNKILYQCLSLKLVRYKINIVDHSGG